MCFLGVSTAPKFTRFSSIFLTFSCPELINGRDDIKNSPPHKTSGPRGGIRIKETGRGTGRIEGLGGYISALRTPRPKWAADPWSAGTTPLHGKKKKCAQSSVLILVDMHPVPHVTTEKLNSALVSTKREQLFSSHPQLFQLAYVIPVCSNKYFWTSSLYYLYEWIFGQLPWSMVTVLTTLTLSMVAI